jgi:hypothetical protein
MFTSASGLPIIIGSMRLLSLPKFQLFLANTFDEAKREKKITIFIMWLIWSIINI